LYIGARSEPRPHSPNQAASRSASHSFFNAREAEEGSVNIRRLGGSDQKSLAPDTPFFLYLAFGATHAPHHVPKEFIEKYRGRFDDGWDAARERIFARHRACAAATRAGLEALGFELFAEPADRSPTVTAAWIPEGLDWKAFNGELRRRRLVLAGGQGKLAGRIFRVGHLGSVTVDEILGAIATLEAVSVTAGRPVQAGAGVAAAQVAALTALAAGASQPAVPAGA